MGQYYQAVLIAKDGEILRGVSNDFNSGIKLMEHSWIGDSFVNAVFKNIEGNPKRVAWIGDYAKNAPDEYDECRYFGNGFIKEESEFNKIYDVVWGDVQSAEKIDKNTPPFDLPEDASGCFLVNVTQNCYIDMEQYVKENTDTDGWCINPLPLLTCVGNGRGGGDYRGSAGENDVGSWAFDEIYITKIKPSNFEEAMFYFHE